jgi:hypothetical protein
MPPSRGGSRAGSGLSGSGRTQESHTTSISRASTLLDDDSGAACAPRGRSGRVQVPDVMMGSSDTLDSTVASSSAALARSERHVHRELSDLKQQYQFAAVQHREDMNIMRSKLMEMQQQLSQAIASRDEAFEAVVNERAVASLRVQESDAAQRDAAKLAQQLCDKLHVEEQRARDLMRGVDLAQKDAEHFKHKVALLEQQQQSQIHKLQEYERQQMDFKRQAIVAEQVQQQLQQQQQQQLQHHQQQLDSLESQLQQQLRAAQKELSAAQLALVDSERHRSNAEARANRFAACFYSYFSWVPSSCLTGTLRNFLKLCSSLRCCQSCLLSPQFLTLCQTLRVELQSIHTAPAAITIAEYTLLQQKLQFSQERMEMVQSHAQNQLKTAEDLGLVAHNEVLRLQVLQCSSPCPML